MGKIKGWKKVEDDIWVREKGIYPLTKLGLYIGFKNGVFISEDFPSNYVADGKITKIFQGKNFIDARKYAIDYMRSHPNG